MGSKQSQANASGQAEISVFAFHIKGDATVVTNALQTLAKQGVSFQPAITPKPPTVALPAPAPTATPETPQEATDEPQLTQTDAVPPSKPRKRNGFAVPKMVDSIRANEGPMSFKEFVGTRNVTTDIEKTVVVASWLRDHRQIEKFGVNELFTCYQMVHWKLPNDPGQPLRNAAKGDYQYLRSEGDGVYSITTAGMNKHAEIV